MQILTRTIQQLIPSILLILTLQSCKEDSTPPTPLNPQEIINSLTQNYTQLPEASIAISADSSVFAQYIDPTDIYPHGTLGDVWEGTGLAVYHEGRFKELALPDNQVFEDITPRLVDVDGDATPELICICTDVDLGAGIAIYRLTEMGIEEYAFVQEIGTTFRWLNLAAVYDLDQDGNLDLAWVETPHIGGVLKVGTIREGEITVAAEHPYVTNHEIGERNLCASALDETRKLIMSSQSRTKVVYITYENGELTRVLEVQQVLDLTQPIYDQLPNTVFLNDNNCRF